MNTTMDHRRARHAHARLQKRQEDLGKDAFGKYRTVLRGAALQVRQLGLIQMAAFWLSKRSKDRSAEVQVLADLVSWLGDSDNLVTGAMVREKDLTYSEIGSQAQVLGKTLLAINAQELALLEREAAPYLEWLARLTEGLWKENEVNDDKRGRVQR